MTAKERRQLPRGIFARERKRGFVYYLSLVVDGVHVQERAGPDFRQAKRLLSRRRSEIAEGTYQRSARSPGITLKGYKSIWIERRRKQGKRTVDDDETRLDLHVLPKLGHMRLDDIRPKHVSDLVWDLRNGGTLAPKTILNIHGVLHCLLEAARFEELIPSNPASKLPRGILPRNEKVRETAPYTREEAERLATDERIPLDRRVLYTMASLTGMRIGEVVGRRWQDYDPSVEQLGLLFVNNQYDGLRLKTQRPRQVPVHPVLASVLGVWKLQGFAMFFRRHPTPDDFIVPNRDGDSRTYNQADKAMRRDCDRIGVPKKGTHAFRRFFITYSRADGARQDVIEGITHNAKGPTVNTKKSGQPKSAKIEISRADHEVSWPIVDRILEFYGLGNENLKVLRESGRKVSDIVKIQAR